MFGRTRLAYLLSICLFLLFPLHALADPLGRDRVKKDETLSCELSSTLSSRVVVYEIDRFMLIASLSYDSELQSTVIPRLQEALAEFRFLFGVDEEAGLWEGEEKGRLVLLKDRKTFRKYVSLFDEEADPDRLSPGFSDAVLEAQSFYWIEPIPYAVCCGQGAGFKEINQHLFHLLGHILLTLHEYNYKFSPPWLHEGFGAYMAVRYADGNILYCTQGLNNALFGTGVYKNLSAWARSDNWPRFVKQDATEERLLPLDRLNRAPLRDFEHRHAALSWSFTTFLIERYSEKLAAYVSALKEMPHSDAPDSNWFPVEFADRTFTDVFELSFKEIEGQWKDWILNGMVASRDRDRSTKTTGTENRIEFDPALHLEEFTLFEGDQRAESFLAPFHKRTGELIAPSDLEALRSTWEKERRKLIAAMALWSRKKLPALDDFIEKLAASSNVQPMTDKEIIELIQPWPSAELCRPAIRYLAGKYGCYGAHTRLRERLDDVADNLPGSGVEGDFEMLQRAASAEAELFEALAEKNASISVDFFPAKMKILSADQGVMVLSARKIDGTDLSRIDSLKNIVVHEKGRMVEIQCAWSCLSVNDLILLAKNRLDRKSETDRYQYCLLCLFRGDEINFWKEFKFVTNGATDCGEIEKLMAQYGRTEKATLFLRQLASDRFEEDETDIRELLSAFVLTRGSKLYDLHEHRATEVLRLLLYRDYASGSRILPSLAGYEGTEDDGETARFVIEFDDPESIDSLDLTLPRRLDYLNLRFKVDPQIEQKPFHIDRGALVGRGLGFAALGPVFTGETEATVNIKVEKMKDGSDDETYYLLFGYGLDCTGAFVAAHGTTHLDIQSSRSSLCQHLEIRPKEEKLDKNRGITLTLRGTADRIVHLFNGEEFTAPASGLRTGRVFFWIYGPVTIRIERLEIKAKLDAQWLRQSLDQAVASDLERLLESSSRTAGN